MTEAGGIEGLMFEAGSSAQGSGFAQGASEQRSAANACGVPEQGRAAHTRAVTPEPH